MTRNFYGKQGFFEKFKKSEIGIFLFSILSFFLCFQNWFLDKTTKIGENGDVLEIENYFTAFDGFLGTSGYFIGFFLLLSIFSFILKVISNSFFTFIEKNSYVYMIFSFQNLLLLIIIYFSYFSYVNLNPFSKILFIIYFLVIIQMFLFVLSIFFFLGNSNKNKSCFDLKVSKYI